MGRDDAKLSSAKMSYQNAKAVGNHHEEARWANVIGDILKNKGEYVQALKWLKIDYDVSVKYLPQKHCLPTCQSLGELYLRLEYFEEALFYQVFIYLFFLSPPFFFVFFGFWVVKLNFELGKIGWRK